MYILVVCRADGLSRADFEVVRAVFDALQMLSCQVTRHCYFLFCSISHLNSAQNVHCPVRPCIA